MEKVNLTTLLTLDIKEKIICFPTDTVYGVGALFNDIKAIEKIYQLKQRNYNKPLAILTPNKDIEKYIIDYENAIGYINKYWPGEVTLIFKKSALIPDEVTKGLDTVAFRMPDSIIALKILNQFGPMATTSVNISGEKELNTIAEIENKFSHLIDYLVIDEERLSLKPSRVFDCTSGDLKIIRK